MPELEIQRDPKQADVDKLQERLVDYNVSQHGFTEVFKTAVFARNDDGSLAGGAYAYGWGGVCQMELLWVAEERRGSGLGTRLMDVIEEDARQRGCSKVVVDTFSYQAPEFYAKRGYQTMGVVDEFPEGHNYFVLVKPLI